MARKKKKGPTPPKAKKKKKVSPVAALMKSHPELSKEQAVEIIEEGLTYEEWQSQQEAAKEARRLANLERMARLLVTQHEKLSLEQAMECVQNNQTPEEYFAEQRRKSRPPQRGKPRGGGRPGGPRKHKRGPNPAQKKQQRRKRIDELCEAHPELSRAIAGQIASGNLTYEQFVASQERKLQKSQSHRTPEEIERARVAREERKIHLQDRVAKESHLGHQGDHYIQKLIEEETHIEIIRFHAPSFDGPIVSVEPFLLFLKTKTQPKLKLIKRYCALFFQKSEQAEVYGQLRIAPHQLSLRQYPHREPSKRFHIPKPLLGEGEPLTVLLHNGLYISGNIVWVDRFQLLLRMPEGGDLFIFKHSVHFADKEAFEPEGGSLSLAEFFTNKPELPKVHPEVLPPTEIEVPVNFDDFPVKDTLYEQYLEAFDNGDFELKPVTVRREGDSYVLIDGYRRLTLALEKSMDALPIVVV